MSFTQSYSLSNGAMFEQQCPLKSSEEFLESLSLGPRQKGEKKLSVRRTHFSNFEDVLSSQSLEFEVILMSHSNQVLIYLPGVFYD